MTDHPRKGKEWREGDRYDDGEIVAFRSEARDHMAGPFCADGGFWLQVRVASTTFFVSPEQIDPALHIPIDSPEESAALRAEVARLKAAEETPNTIDMSKGGAS